MVDEQSRNANSVQTPARSLWRGAYVNDHGEEVEITEHLIQQACRSLENELDNHLLIPDHKKPRATLMRPLKHTRCCRSMPG